MTGNSGWDVVFPTHSRLAPMARNGLLAHLDHCPSAFSPKSRCPLPTPRLGPGPSLGRPLYVERHRHRVQPRAPMTPPPRGWADLWNPTLRGRLTMLDDPEDVIGACLQKLGYPFGSIDERQLQAAKTEAVRQKQLLRAYLNAEVRDQLVSGDVLAAQLWSTTAAQAIHGNAESRVRLSGGRLSALLRLRRDSARKQPLRTGARISRIPAAARCRRGQRPRGGNGDGERSRTGNCRDPVLYPPDEIYRRGIWPAALPSAAQRYRDRLWTEIKSA